MHFYTPKIQNDEHTAKRDQTKTQARHRGPHIYCLESAHAIDVDKASIIP